MMKINVPIGVLEDGAPLVRDWTRCLSMATIGSTGSGKSECTYNINQSLVSQGVMLCGCDLTQITLGPL